MKNIAILTTSLQNGGAERFVLNLHKILTNLNYNVYIVSVNNTVVYDVTGIQYFTLHSKKAYLKPYLLLKFLRKNNIELIIDNRTKLSVLKTLIYEFVFQNIKKIKIVHSYKIENYFINITFLNKYIYPKYNKIIGVSNQIVSLIKQKFNLDNVLKIYNAIPEISLIGDELLARKYILYYGRFENDVKDLTFLLNSFKNSNLISNNIFLYLLGSGPDLDLILKCIKKLDIEGNVVVLNARSNPFSIVEKALCTVLTSNYEGFPMTIVESLSLGVPVVTTDFDSGPKELIKTNYNGIMVKKIIIEFANALDKMALDVDFNLYCKNNAKESVGHLEMDIISQEWNNLLKNI